MREKVNSLWFKLIEFICLILLSVAAAVILLPIIILSLQVVIVTSLLLGVGFLWAWVFKGAAHLHAWFGKHHWAIHKHSGPPGFRTS